MRLKEALNKQLQGAAKLGSSKFRLSLDKEKVLTPHSKMSGVLDVLDTRPSVKSGLSDICRFILNDIGVMSEDKKSLEFMREWLDKRQTIKTEMFNFVYLLLGGGTSYVQPSYKNVVGKGKIINNIEHVPDPSIIYRNVEAKEGANDYWLMRVPIEVREYDGVVPQYRPIVYIKGSKFFHEYIWCIPYPKETYEVMTFGHSRDLPNYGAGFLTSSIDNEDILREILKNWALQAKYRALGKKILGFYNSSDDAVSLQELEDIREQFATLEEEDSLIVNKRFDQTDLSFTGQDATMDMQIEWLRKDSGSSLVPNFMTAFSMDSSMATASEAKIPFELQLKAIQPLIIQYFNNVIINKLRKTYNFLKDDLTFTLAEPQLYSRDEVFNMIIQLYNNRAATFNELRKSAGLSTVEGGDVWGQEPPLENTRVSITNKQPLTEKYKKDKIFIEALKETKPEPFKKEHNIQFNVKGKDKKTNLKEAVKRFIKR